MMRCDWCHKPIYGGGDHGWGYQLGFKPFHSLGLGRKVNGEPIGITLGAHVHPKPCRDELGWGIRDLLADREPLETDGPSDDDEAIDVAEEDAKTAAEQRRDRIDAEIQARIELRSHWRDLDKPGRQRLALNALGDDRLTARQVFERVARELPDGALYRSDIDPVLKLLLDGREVERVREQRGARMLWVYERRRALEGPIVDLDAAFREGEPD